MNDTERVLPTSIRLPQSLKDDLEVIAKRERRSLNNLIVGMLLDAVAEDKKKSDPK